MDWLDLLAVQGTLKSLLQHHSSKASILQHSAFFMVQLSHPYMITIALTIWTFVGKVMFLLLKHCLGLSSPHSSTLAWKIPWTEESGRLQSMGPQRVGHNWANSLTYLASASVLPISIQGWFLLRWTGWPPCCTRDFQESFPAPQFKGINSLVFCLLHGPAFTIIPDLWEDHSLDYMDFGSWIMSLLLNTLSKFIIAFLPRSNHLLISRMSHHMQWF